MIEYFSNRVGGLYYIVALCMVLLVNGCATLAVTGATSAGVAVAEERSFGTVIDDATIVAEINSHFIQKDVNQLFQKVSVTVNEGRVLLTGSVNNPKVGVEAVRLSWIPNGVKEVINEIQVNNKSSLTDYAKDVFISAQIKGKILLEKNVRSINYNVETVNGTVYMIGIARNNIEMQKVAEIASRVKGVGKVISHIRVMGGK